MPRTLTVKRRRALDALEHAAEAWRTADRVLDGLEAGVLLGKSAPDDLARASRDQRAASRELHETVRAVLELGPFDARTTKRHTAAATSTSTSRSDRSPRMVPKADQVSAGAAAEAPQVRGTADQVSSADAELGATEPVLADMLIRFDVGVEREKVLAWLGKPDSLERQRAHLKAEAAGCNERMFERLVAWAERTPRPARPLRAPSPSNLRREIEAAGGAEPWIAAGETEAVRETRRDVAIRLGLVAAAE